MAKEKVFVSLDYDSDINNKHLMEAWDANPDFEFIFEDRTPDEIDTKDISETKAGLTQKINDAAYTLFIVGMHANQEHKDSGEIGSINWMNFEAYKSIENNNYLAVVKLEKAYAVPQELTAKYWLVEGFSERNVIQVLKDSIK